ncbi:cytochrome P450 7B1 isoform X1 [Hypanus sabinus]|uniref:cytochrome P450 7B1 isoform X1 n=1 Tax=Hypanus sabinus TaxID=79690 RepID=UPI0028C3DF2B|nr:cytochrome P450 7B1 isoform X1 [Hypanus sabinus]
MALVFGVLFAVALLLLLKCLTGRKRRPGEPPVVQGWIPFIGQTIEFGRDSHGFLLSCQRKLGDVFTVYIAGKYVTFILDPFLFHLISQLGKQIDFQEFSLGLAAKVFGFPILNDPKIPISNEEIHKLYHYLKGDELNILIRSTTENLQNIMRRDLVRSTEWRIEYMYDFCCRIIFEATYVSLYGKAPINEEKKITELKEKFIKFDQMFPYLAASIPIELLGNTKRIHKELISYLTSKELDQRLCMAKLIQGRRDLFDRYPYLQDDQKAAHHLAFLWAGVANTIPAMFWSLYYIVKHPEACATVRDEIDHMLQAAGQRPGPDFNIAFSKEDLDSLVTLGSAIDEAFRLGSSSMNIRFVKEDVNINFKEEKEIKLRKGDLTAIYPQILHMDPEVFEDPEVYKYDRFIENGMKKTTFYKGGKKLRNYLMPFGSGASKCPGRYFAVSEIKMFISLILTAFDLEIIHQERPVMPSKSRVGLGVLHPESDVQFRYKLRQ